jgi:hypothetical protein
MGLKPERARQLCWLDGEAAKARCEARAQTLSRHHPFLFNGCENGGHWALPFGPLWLASHSTACGVFALREPAANALRRSAMQMVSLCAPP